MLQLVLFSSHQALNSDDSETAACVKSEEDDIEEIEAVHVSVLFILNFWRIVECHSERNWWSCRRMTNPTGPQKKGCRQWKATTVRVHIKWKERILTQMRSLPTFLLRLHLRWVYQYFIFTFCSVWKYRKSRLPKCKILQYNLLVWTPSGFVSLYPPHDVINVIDISYHFSCNHGQMTIIWEVSW